MIDWSKLKPYERDKSRSFEELCYQIAKGLYGHLGRFTSIDDSGGGDGVEFYLTFPNGDQWGWQAKLYYPDGSLRISNRKTSVKKSLQKACDEHPRLRKWFLCTPRNLTPGDQGWFDERLAQSRVNRRLVMSTGRNIELENWGESDFIAWMSELKFAGKKLFFFGELELTLDRFRTQVEKQIAAIRDKFNPFLHTETSVDARIHALLGDEAFIAYITERITGLENQLEEYKEAVTNLDSRGLYQIEWGSDKPDLLVTAKLLQDALVNAITQLQQACRLLSERRFDEIRRLDWEPLWPQLEEAYHAYKKAESAFDTSKLVYTGKDEDRERVLREAERIVHRPAWVAANLMDDLRGVVGQLDAINQPDLHILGDAGIGKTHIVSHISGLPALLVLGRHFTSDRPLWEQLLRILDVPSSYSWNDFLQALEAAAEAYHTRIPLVIDGLNEATFNGAFSNVWRLYLPGLIQEIAQTKNVVLITTCRTTYKGAIWPKGIPQNTEYAYGFDAYDVETAIYKYFTWYKIKADLTASPLSQFEQPIYLKIFCESKNPTRQEEKHVYVGDYTLFEVFDDYLEQANRAVCERLGLHRSASVVIPALNKMAEYLWQQRSRSIPLTELVTLVDGQPLERLNWQQSRTEAILNEGLLVCRDWGRNGEVVYFTYDLLGGYLIARYLIQQATNDIEAFLHSKETIATLFGDDYRILHPLYSDIRRCLAALLPVQRGQYLHDLSDNPIARCLSIKALFEIPPDIVDDACVDLVTHLFENPQDRKPLLKLATSTVGHVHHPLNASLWSKRLKALPMPERDISWTEYVRENVEQFEKTLVRFEAACQSDEPLSKMEARLCLLAEHIMWLLTSTVRPLRDKATRALYWYGRRFPEQFFDLVLSSLEINDPYVPERMLAATYGVAMARQYDFRDPSFAEIILPIYGRKLYEAMFKPNAPYATTHILARDYARRTIGIALIHHPDLLTEEERKRIMPPFTDGGIREWGESEDRNESEYQEGNAPIQMDFGNYTLGRLVKDRANYDFEHKEYRRARANIFWRIYDLGYSLNTFGEIDKWIVRGNWQYGRAARGKTDRYGKKYSWIAFYELAGFRQDLGLLDEWYDDARISDADIDPSFPVEVQEYNLIQADFLRDRDLPVEEWILHGGLPDLEPYLIIDELCGEQGPWVLLDGYINQEDAKAKRSRFIFPRGFIVKAEEAGQIVERLKQQDLGGRWLPEIPEDYYTYAGEIPWGDTYPLNELSELNFVVGTSVTTDLVEKPVLFRDNRPIPADEEEEFWNSISDRVIKAGRLTIVLEDVDAAEVIEAELRERELEMKVCTVPVEREVHRYERFEVLIPVRVNNWEDYHSTIIAGRRVLTPAKELAEHLDLCGQPQTFDLFEKSGRRASITFCYGEAWHTVQKLTYLRQDLLERFLAETNSELIWAIWGERKHYSTDRGIRETFDKDHKPYKVFQQIIQYSMLKEGKLKDTIGTSKRAEMCNR